MRALLQRVASAKVTVTGREVGKTGPGLLVFLGVATGDTREDADYIARKILTLRIFPDQSRRMNQSVLDSNGSILVVSQFTLHASTHKGRRPGFDRAAPPEIARNLYDYTCRVLAQSAPVQTGVFGALMEVSLVNDGPVTILLDSDDRRRPSQE